MNKWVIAIIVLVVLVGGYYLSMNKNANVGPAQKPEADSGKYNSPQDAALKMRNDVKLGVFLTASNGLTLYMYSKDAKDVSNCSGTCATNWPPYTVSADRTIFADPGITGKVDTIKRADGSMQITYDGKPLYFWKDDKVPGDATGQNVGKVWFVVKP